MHAGRVHRCTGLAGGCDLCEALQSDVGVARAFEVGKGLDQVPPIGFLGRKSLIQYSDYAAVAP